MKRVKLTLPDIGDIEGYAYKGFLVISDGPSVSGSKTCTEFGRLVY